MHGCKVLPSSLETRPSRIFSPEVARAQHLRMTCLAYRHLCVAGCQRTVMIERPMPSESFQSFPRAMMTRSLHGISRSVSTNEADIRILRNGHDRLHIRLTFISAPTKAAFHGQHDSGMDTSVARSQHELRFVDHVTVGWTPNTSDPSLPPAALLRHAAVVLGPYFPRASLHRVGDEAHLKSLNRSSQVDRVGYFCMLARTPSR